MRLSQYNFNPNRPYIPSKDLLLSKTTLPLSPPTQSSEEQLGSHVLMSEPPAMALSKTARPPPKKISEDSHVPKSEHKRTHKKVKKSSDITKRYDEEYMYLELVGVKADGVTLKYKRNPQKLIPPIDNYHRQPLLKLPKGLPKVVKPNPSYPFWANARNKKDWISFLQREVTEEEKDSVKDTSVIVVGGGITGLTVAYELDRHGYNVTLLESSKRCGGRLKTLREFNDKDLWGEAGAMRIPPEHFLVHAYMDKFNIETSPFTNNNQQVRLYFDEPGIPNKCTINSNMEQKEQLKQYWMKTYGVKQDPSDKFNVAMARLQYELIETGVSWDYFVQKYDKYSLKTFLIHECKWSKNDIDLLSASTTTETLIDVGAIEVFQEYLGFFWDDDSKSDHPTKEGFKIEGLKEVKGGMDKLTKGFLDNLSNVKIVNNATVTKIDSPQNHERDRKITVTAKTKKDEKVRYHAHYVVITIPTIALSYIEVNPPFIPQKQWAIRTLPYSPAVKIFLEYNKKWWLDKNFDFVNGGQGCVTTLPIRTVYFPPTRDNTEGGGVVIVSYVWMHEAIKWACQKEKTIISKCRKCMNLIFDGIPDQYFTGKYKIHSWQNKPTYGGGFAFFGPGHWNEYYGPLKKAEGGIRKDGDETDKRILFAGEHESAVHGWIQGAMESSYRVVVELDNKNHTRLNFEGSK